MANETLTQGGIGFPAGSGIDFACNMTDQNNKSQSVDVNVPANAIKFNNWGPSTGTISNVVTSGQGGGGNPGHVTFNIAGTGNITGNGNDDAYSGSGAWDLTWEFDEIRHQYRVYAKNGSVSLTYTD